jgi:hypothetical protein
MTGAPVLKGRLSIGSEADTAALGILGHDRLLLASCLGSLFIWPVANLTRDDHGFCNTTLGEFGLALDGLQAQDIGNLSSPGASRSFMRGGLGAGCLVRRHGPADGSCSPNWRVHTPIQAYELKAEYRSEGLHFAISGQFAEPDDAKDAQAGPMPNGVAFSINATIPWETLVLKDFSGPFGHWKIGYSTVSVARQSG